jgi:hypothetical protein
VVEKPANPERNDDFGQILTWILAGVVSVLVATLCTGPSLIGAGCVSLLAWFLGRGERHFLLLLALGGSTILTCMIFASGEGASIVLAWAHSYFLGFASSGWVGVYSAFLYSFYPGREWGLGVGIGVAVTSAIILVRDARQRSPSAQLLQTKFPSRRRPPPLVRFRRWWVTRHLYIPGFVTLGTDLASGVRVAIRLVDLLRHMLVVGTTGSGKTNSIRVIIDACLRAGWSVLFLCGKGDSALAAENRALAEALGIETYILDANNPDESCIYNPLATGDATSRTNRLLQMSDYSEPHYRKLCASFAQTAFTVLDAADHRIDLLQMGNYLDTKALLAALRRKDIVDRDHAQTLANHITEQRKNEGHIDGLRADIRNLGQSSLCSLFDTRIKDRKILEIAKARAEGAYVHCVLPALAYPDWTRQLGRLIVEDVKAAAAADDRHFLVVLDEAHAYAAESLASLAAMGRSFNLALVVGTQSYAQLQNVSAKGPHQSFLDALLASINLHIIHAVRAPSDAEIAASLTGTVADLEVTAQTESDIPSQMGSLRAVRSYTHHPDRLKNLPVGEAIFLNKIDSVVSHVKVPKV